MRARRHAFFSGGGFAFSPTLTGLVADYNLATAATAAGWDGVTPLVAKVTIASGAIVYGTSTTAGAAAFTVPALPAGSLVTIVRGGTIIGRGGSTGVAGNDGLKLSYPATLSGDGLIAGGGGGGGQGGGITIDSPNGTYNSPGGGGGNGAGQGANLSGGAGAPGTRTGDATYYAQGGKGGDGGGPGLPGQGGVGGTGVGSVSSTTPPQAGGASGNAIAGAEFVTLAGALGDVRGPLSFGANSYVATPTATPAIGSALDGGFYAGYGLWAAIALESGYRTPTNTVVNLFIPSMIGAPKVYGGQTLWLKSAANPSLFMKGVVLGAAAGLVSLNVTEVGGSEAASDWVLMATHRVVVAEKTGGEAVLSIAGSTLPMPLDTYTLTEGRIAQSALLSAAAGDPLKAAAASWAAGLTLGGKSDWTVPTRDQLEAIYRGLKPLIVNNYISADRASTPINTYLRFGAPADTSNRHGYKGSDPTVLTPGNSYYTVSQPSRTTNTAFQVGGAQALEYGAAQYLTSTAYDADSVWAQSLESTQPGRQMVVPKTTTAYVRAVRMSMI